MPRTFLVVTATLFLLFSNTIEPVRGQEIETLSLKIADQMDERNKASVSVLDFTNLDGETTDVGQYLADEIADILVNMEDEFDVVDRSVINEILKEESFASAVNKNPSVAKEIEASTGVEVLVSGTITPFRDRVRVNVKMFDTALEKTVWGSTSNIKPSADMKELLALQTPSSASKKGKSAKPLPQFKNRYLRVTVTSLGISPTYKTAVVGLLIENISKEDIKIALRPPANPIYLVETAATLIDDSGISCRGADTSGINTDEYSLLTAKSSTVVVISFNCESIPEGEFGTLTADFFAEARRNRTGFSIGIPRIQLSAFRTQRSLR